MEGGQCFAQAAIANISITPERDMLKDQIGRLCRDPPAKRSRGADGFTFYDLIKTRGLSSNIVRVSGLLVLTSNAGRPPPAPLSC